MQHRILNETQNMFTLQYVSITVLFKIPVKQRKLGILILILL